MIEQKPMRAAGTAMMWQAFQVGGVKIVYMIRLLVLAILLTPADFGLIAIALSSTGFLLNLTNFGLIPAVVQATDMDDGAYDAVWTFEVTRSVIVTTLTILFAPVIANIFAEPRAVPLIQILALRPLVESFISIKTAALNRNLTFRPLAFLKIIEAIFNAVISIGLAKTFGVWAMVFGMIGGAVSMVIASYILAPYRPRLVFDWSAVKPLLKFGGWLLVTGVLAMLGNFGLRIVISRQVGADGLGLYFLATSLAFLPSEVASEVVGTVAFPMFARLQSSLQQAARAFQAILTGLMALLYPICALIIVLSPVVVKDILGEKWNGTVPLIQILALVTMIGLLGDATIPLVKGFGQSYRVTQIELVQSSSLILIIWFFTSGYGVIGAALAWLPTIAFVQMLSIYFIWDIFHDPLKEARKPLF
ncbi:MAG TPA: lipopolysaccharide biosynthesis protein, partial [Anaerolineales bacterium]|nr:lipopolysaccharide biosynthesis protein [Anaerolineales bacterium]